MAFEIIDRKTLTVFKDVEGNVKNKEYIEASCASTDTKPEDDSYVTGSIALEADTGTVFFYDADGATGSKWVEQFSFQG